MISQQVLKFPLPEWLGAPMCCADLTELQRAPVTLTHFACALGLKGLRAVLPVSMLLLQQMLVELAHYS